MEERGSSVVRSGEHCRHAPRRQEILISVVTEPASRIHISSSS